MNKSLKVIFIAYGLSFIILIVAFVFAQRLNSLIDYSNEIEQTYRVRNQVLKVQSYLIQAENSQRGFILLKDSSLLKPIRESQISILNEIQTLFDLTKDDKNEQQLVGKLKANVSLRYQILYQAIDEAIQGNLERFIVNANKGMKIMGDIQRIASQLEQEELKQLKQSEKRKKIFERAAPIYLNLILIISCIFQLLSFIFIIREFKRSILYHKELEKKIHELNVSNAEMEQIAFVASHDLQEPLRKIRTFSDRLINKYKTGLDEEGKIFLERLSSAALRMQGLIEDLIKFTNLLKIDEEPRQVDLNNCVAGSLKELQQLKEARRAVINIEPLPIIEGYEKQLHLLFINLLENALKFARPDISPIIDISVTVENGMDIEAENKKMEGEAFYKITISDNGIGFEKEFASKIFIIFQRLHTQNSEYPGKGIGLAICKRVAINHNGFITATGEPNNGAVFNLYLPKKPLS